MTDYAACAGILKQNSNTLHHYRDIGAGLSVAVAQLGFRRHYAVPIILNKAGILERLYTDLYLGKWPWRQFAASHLSRYLPKKAKILFGRRVALPSEKVCAFQRFGLTFLWKSQRAHPSDVWRVNAWAREEFNRLIINEGIGRANCVYGFPGQCLELFRYARRLGLRCVLDQCLAARPIQDRLVRPEYDRWPGWEDPPSAAHVESISHRMMEQWELADLILCPSNFVKRGLEEMGIPQDKCKVVPYGVHGQIVPAQREHRDHDGPLRILFVGQVRLLKGIPYLLDAMRQFKVREAVCRLVGSIKVARDKLQEYAPPNVSICGPVARDKVRKYYEWADVFCLPTLCEGSATVIYEALLHGLPVITTANSGSIIEPATNSHHVIVPIRDANAIAEAIRKLGRHRYDGLNEAESSNLSARASLDAYSERLLNALLSLDTLDVRRIR